jgi:pilus assembly protein CpaF
MYSTKKVKLSPTLEDFRDQAFKKLLMQIDLEAATKSSVEDLRKEVESFVMRYTDESSVQINFSEQRLIAEQIVNDMVGLGPLEPLLADENISDILVNNYHSVYIERYGHLEETDVSFRNEKHAYQVAQRIANKVGRRVDEASPICDARLPDGSRVNIIVPPLALEGVSISIRQFRGAHFTLAEMIELGSLSKQLEEFLQIASKSRLNTIVTGGTGSGKTTLLNALSQQIDPRERIVTIEDSAELRLQQPHVVRLESRPANIESKGEVTIRDLVKNALRMRPDRIVVGECRGGEAFDMLQAMNTGHDGSMSTLHCNSASDALDRMENMVLMAGFNLPNLVIKRYIESAIDLIVHVARMRDGKRRITQIAEVMGLEGDRMLIQDLFVFEYEGEDEKGNILGKHVIKSKEMKCATKIRLAGLEERLHKVINKKHEKVVSNA